MERVLDVAQFLADEYRRVYGTPINQVKLHKLLYLSQRESYAVFGELLFSEIMEGWKRGPVSPDVRVHFHDSGLLDAETNPPSEDAIYLLKNVILEYGGMSTAELVDLTHEEVSWKNARSGLDPEDPGTTPLNVEDIKKDAQKIRPYDHIWDMYYDEFDDYAAESAVF